MTKNAIKMETAVAEIFRYSCYFCGMRALLYLGLSVSLEATRCGQARRNFELNEFTIHTLSLR